MKILTLDKIDNLKDKIVLLRADLNSDIVEGKVKESQRIKASAETIKQLKKKKAKIVIIAHQGKKGKRDFSSLKEHAKFLNKYTKVEFVPDIKGKKAESQIKKLKNGQAILLENIRYEDDELKPEKGKKNKLYRLAILSDIYVNDAFSVCHRKHSSIVLLPRYLPCYAGRLLEKEISALENVDIKNALFILGGSKPEDNLKLIKTNQKNKIITCGIFGQLCNIVRGYNLGKNNENENKRFIKNYENVMRKLKRKLKKINKKRLKTPEDFAVKIKEKRQELKIEEFPTDHIIYDIGEKTIKKYKQEIKKAKSIYMKGPAGFCGYKDFCKGTKEILKTIAKSKGFSLIGGGHLSDAIKKSGISKNKFNHISLSGGALLRYLAGEKLPGIEILKKRGK